MHIQMAPLNLLIPSLLLAFSLLIFLPPRAFANNSKLFREYIGAGSSHVDLSDVPVNHDVDFHFILAFAIDYTVTNSSPPTPANGVFTAFWDTDTLTPYKIASLKRSRPNVKLALSLGGDSFNDNTSVYFRPFSVNSWVANAVSSLTRIIKLYNLDGIDIDYEHFLTDPDTFAECIGRLITTLKVNKVISFASIAPFDDREVKIHYRALWNEYGRAIDYVNFQFYAYDSTTNATQFAEYFEEQSVNYYGGNVLVALSTDNSSSGGLLPQNGFFDACNELKMQNKLHGIFIWAADYSISNGFWYEIIAQKLLASA